jgi:hypothetical protein
MVNDAVTPQSDRQPGGLVLDRRNRKVEPLILRLGPLALIGVG